MADKIYRDIILNPDESLIRLVRKPPIVLIGAIIVPIGLIAADFFFLYRLTFYFGEQGLVVFGAIASLSLVWIARSFIIWYYQIMFITSQRIFDVDRRGLFRKTVSTVPLSKVQDVYYEVKGVWQTVFKVGTVYVYVTDSKTRIEIDNVSRPQRLQQLILQLKSDTLKDKLDSTNLSAAELIELVRRIKVGIGDKKFKEILNQADADEGDEEEEDDDDDNEIDDDGEDDDEEE